MTMISMYRAGVAHNKNTPADTLRLLAKDDNWEVREGVAENENTPPDALRTLSKEVSYTDVRRRVAVNYNTPVDVLGTLAKDNNNNNKIVRDIALRRLKERIH